MPLLYLNPLPSRTRRGDVLEWLVSAGGIERKRVGRIDLQGPTAVVEVPEGWEVRLAKALDGAEYRTGRLRAWSGRAETHGSDEDHFQRLARLLDLEARAEAAQAAAELAQLSAADAERSGRCLTDLVIAEESSGLGGRCLLTLAKRNRTLDLPWTRLQAGSPVLLRAEDAAPASGWRGVVCERGERYLRVALNEPPDEADGARLPPRPVERRGRPHPPAGRPGTRAHRTTATGWPSCATSCSASRTQLRPGNGVCAARSVPERLAAGGGPLRPVGPRPGHHARPARHRQDDDGGRADPPGGPPRRQGPGLRPEQPGGR